ncbi:alpha/beta fold hydrolase [Mycoplasma mycoides subsp. mycoides]|uniref:AB hydrolase-1 domain-containing protein n=2 Tax=Mycoplasma mycoides subsp. mycoides TaxID=2103 RepID=Q6MT27_MYCMS|nr:alpha/beta fold hydrolase [Mycoplasma mycoides]CAE77209.1 Conserved hypothetical protein [Mycoplasma mycoides subsp. mycoides SC str. PG1]ADK69713.1 conserved hypothetical protein [Mycoplasma mycoides subsp. mycoides SC str. Gladysdale]AIZ55444.1 hypothetical protein mycmycITA_00621 [Mycoplasma mycoides subsp. mycoides]AME10794.1 hypothetical protein MmmBen_0632 [Mycoplasma mycoides subsp. mycoides]AME11801.1 hypothetical protein MmmBen50_0618 [Mycoplasma mycoides subsp. mycoides]
MNEKYPNLAKTMINMWNSRFSKIIHKRDEGFAINFSPIKIFSFLNSINRNSNKKLKIKEYKNPNLNFWIYSLDNTKLAASIWLNEKQSNKWVIGVHGYNSNRLEVLYLVWHYQSLGYNILTFDFRNHGISDSNCITWGYKEKWDLISVVNWLIKHYDVELIGLVGTSMGAFTTNYFLLTENELIKKANIKWAISDSSYMSVKNLLQRMIKDYSPKFLSNLSKDVLDDILEIYKNEYEVDLTKLDFVDLITINTTYIPVLYIHNRLDKVTSYLDSFRMYQMKNNIENSFDNQIEIYDHGSHHTKSIIEFENEYITKSLNFVKLHQKNRHN